MNSWARLYLLYDKTVPPAAMMWIEGPLSPIQGGTQELQ